MNDVVLDIQDLRTYFQSKMGWVKAVDGVSFQLRRGRTLGLVGESGSGKSVSALTILKLLDMPPARIHSGKIIFEDQDLTALGESEMQAIRGRYISMIFQEPMTSLNPLLRIGAQIKENLRAHYKLSASDARKKVVDLIAMVDIPSPEKRINDYPHQLSGGMRQRIMIAMALACDPKVLIADEPTTALDVTIQAQILDLLRKIQTDFGTSILMITHDLGVIADTADEVAVMYAGKIVEIADVRKIFRDPLHPYTQGLLRSVPRVDETQNKDRLEEIPGVVPNLWKLPPGCAFFDRCPVHMERCRETMPQLVALDDRHRVRCWRISSE
jgi:oligopeptide/dipeptide ABC transporter ATP-binding protein